MDVQEHAGRRPVLPILEPGAVGLPVVNYGGSIEPWDPTRPRDRQMLARATLAVVLTVAVGIWGAQAKSLQAGSGANHGASTFTPSYLSQHSTDKGGPYEPARYYAPSYQSRRSTDNGGAYHPPSYYAPGHQLKK